MDNAPIVVICPEVVDALGMPYDVSVDSLGGLCEKLLERLPVASCCQSPAAVKTVKCIRHPLTIKFAD